MYRKDLYLGLNKVTKGLEKDELRLVLVCKSAEPKFITSHLIGLSAVRNCHSMQVKDLSKTMSQILNISSALAVGFKVVF